MTIPPLPDTADLKAQILARIERGDGAYADAETLAVITAYEAWTSAVLEEVRETLKPFAEVGRVRGSPFMRACWAFDSAFVDDSEFRRAAALLSAIGGEHP